MATSTAKKTAAPKASTAAKTDAERLREPFPAASVGKLPRSTCKECGPWRACDRHRWVNNCGECGGRHSSAVIHLDYVGHAAATDRLLRVDPSWSWEPVHRDVDPQVLAAAVASGNPDMLRAVLDAAPPKIVNGGMWIRLTVEVDGERVTRLGYGDAQGKSGANAVKECIGDAIRNAAMRFGVALDLWAKEDLLDAEVEQGKHEPEQPPADVQQRQQQRSNSQARQQGRQQAEQQPPADEPPADEQQPPADEPPAEPQGDRVDGSVVKAQTIAAQRASDLGALRTAWDQACASGAVNVEIEDPENAGQRLTLGAYITRRKGELTNAA